MREAALRTCLPALTFLNLFHSSPRAFNRAVLTDDCACVYVSFGCARVRGDARSRRPVIEEIRSDEECVIRRPPADAADAVVYLLLFFNNWDVT